MQSSDQPVVQQTVRRTLLRGAALAYLVFSVASLLLTLRLGNGVTILLATLFLGSALIFWQCSRWLKHNQHVRLAVRLSTGALLFVTTAYSLVAPAKLPTVSAIVYILVLLFSSMADTRRSAWVVCALCSLLHICVVWLRQQWYGVNVGADPGLGWTVYAFIPFLFVLITFIATDFSHYIRQTLRRSVGLRRDLLNRNLEYQVLLETMNEGFIVVDENDRFAFVNSRFCEIVDLTHEELLGQSYLDFAELTVENRACLAEQRTLRLQNQRSTYELPMRRRDGRPITLLISAIPNVDEDGVYFGSSCVVSDITERKEAEAALRAERAALSKTVAERTASLQKANEALASELFERQQAEQALRAAEAEFRLLFNRVPIGLYRAQLDGQLLRANPALAQITGYENEAALLAAWRANPSIWYADTQRRAEFFRLLFADGSVANFESTVRRVDTEETFWISESAAIIHNAEGEPLYYQGTVEDITERKQAALQQERLLNELARVAKMKDEFLANISHELRTPLNGILALTELLGDQIYGPVTIRQQKALATISESGEHLLSLINDILDLAKAESVQAELNLAPFDLNQVCQASMKFVEPAAQKKKIRIYFTPDTAVTTLIADQQRVKQILINLLNNAVKFTPERGAVGLEILGVKTPEPIVKLVVWDTGVGIPPQESHSIFRPFVQLDSRLARQHEGTGLGLALVEQFTYMHGGSVMVQSQEERGSRFIVSLPWRTAIPQTQANDETSPQALPPNPMGTAAAVTEPAPVADGPFIIFVTDESPTSQMFVDYLRFKHFEVALVETMMQARAAADHRSPALILVDLPAGAEHNEDLLDRSGAATNLAHTPMIKLMAPVQRGSVLASGAAQSAARQPADRPQTMMLSKPVSLQELVTVVENLLRRPTAQIAPSPSRAKNAS